MTARTITQAPATTAKFADDLNPGDLIAVAAESSGRMFVTIEKVISAKRDGIMVDMVTEYRYPNKDIHQMTYRVSFTDSFTVIG